jgi:SAM-dependent methyltransferase
MNDIYLIDKKLIKVLYLIKKLIFSKSDIKNFFYDDFFLSRFLSHISDSHGLWFWIYNIFSKTFQVQANSYHYFYHQYNSTWLNERCVEVSVILEIFKRYQGKNILEIGNVLSNYYPTEHDIVDKYEKGEGVVNEDVVDYQPSKKYDLIVSISTLEHVGWDETPRDPMKLIRAIKNLRNLLTSNGKIVVTIPIGYNPHLDKLIDEEKMPLSKQICLKRISNDNKWKEVNWNEISDIKYNKPFPGANGLVIGIIKKNN